MEGQRLDLIAQYAASKVFDGSWNGEARRRLAIQAEGMSGRSIGTIINDAAYRAALRKANAISAEDIEQAFSAESNRITQPNPPKETHPDTKPNELPGSVPNVSWDDIVGLDGAKFALRNCARLLKTPSSLIRIGSVPRRGFLLVGARGTGKSILAAALATELGARVFQTDGSSYFGCGDATGAARIREIFANARSVPRALVLIDGLDALGKRRSNGWSGPSGAINQMMAELDGLGNTNLVVIGTAERPDAMDEALREGPPSPQRY